MKKECISRNCCSASADSTSCYFIYECYYAIDFVKKVINFNTDRLERMIGTKLSYSATEQWAIDAEKAYWFQTQVVSDGHAFTILL